MRGELDGDAHDRLRGGLVDSSDLSSRASLQFYDDDDDTERLDNSFHRHSKRSSKDQMQHSQKSSFASSQFTSPRHQNKKDSTQLNQDLRLPLRALSQQETFRSPRSKMSDVPEAWLVFANNNEQGGGRGAGQGVGFGTERAVPVNLANSIGSRLQVRSIDPLTKKDTIVNLAFDINNGGISRQALPT